LTGPGGGEAGPLTTFAVMQILLPMFFEGSSRPGLCSEDSVTDCGSA
jgi:hypothetical protein